MLKTCNRQESIFGSPHPHYVYLVKLESLDVSNIKLISFLMRLCLLNRSQVCLQKAVRNSLAVQWLGHSAFPAEAWVQSLVGDLRSRKLLSSARKDGGLRNDIGPSRCFC